LKRLRRVSGPLSVSVLPLSSSWARLRPIVPLCVNSTSSSVKKWRDTRTQSSSMFHWLHRQK